MSEQQICPVCAMTDVLDGGDVHECATCGQEWAKDVESEEIVVEDANGNRLVDGDNVTLIKDLKVKGSSATLKSGTKIKKIRLVDPAQNADHDIDARSPAGMGILLKSRFVRKA